MVRRASSGPPTIYARSSPSLYSTFDPQEPAIRVLPVAEDLPLQGEASSTLAAIGSERLANDGTGRRNEWSELPIGDAIESARRHEAVVVIRRDRLRGAVPAERWYLVDPQILGTRR